VTLTLIGWPLYKNLTRNPSTCTHRPKTNFQGRGFRKLWDSTYIHRPTEDRLHRNNYHAAAWWAVTIIGNRTEWDWTRNAFCGTWYLPHSHVHYERIVPVIWPNALCTRKKRSYVHFRSKIWRHHRVPRPRFPLGRENFDDSHIICMIFRTFWPKMGVLWGKIGEGVVRYWPLTNSFFLFVFFRSVPILVKIDQEMRPWECSQTDRYTDRLTDANRFYNLSHAICYSYGTDKKKVLLISNIE